ncbi:MAG TPA: hypothetical protein VKV73_02305 [Chloroflexota bacterium]|nr:hypothetical protein [Chloroflexota bacterium]
MPQCAEEQHLALNQAVRPDDVFSEACRLLGGLHRVRPYVAANRRIVGFDQPLQAVPESVRQRFSVRDHLDSALGLSGLARANRQRALAVTAEVAAAHLVELHETTALDSRPTQR